MRDPSPAWYRLVRTALRGIVELYYPGLVVTGAERVPDGPLIVAANHPNSILDPVILSTTLPRRIAWLAKATLFESPLARRLLRRFGVIPVHRRHEGGTRDTTTATLDAAASAVVQGEALGIFPEGLSHDAPRLAPLRTGVGRIAVLAASRLPAGTRVPVLPVALHFLDAARFASEAVVAVAQPILVSAEDSPDEVTALVRERLEQLLVHVEDDDQHRLMLAVRQLERRRLLREANARTPEERHRIDVEIARAIRRFASEEPERLEAFRVRLLAYLERLDAAGISTHHVDAQALASARDAQALASARDAQAVATASDEPVLAPGRRPTRRGSTRAAAALALALLPLAALGFVQSFPPWRLAGWFGRLRGRGEDTTTLSFHYLTSGLVIFPAAWIGETLLVARLGSWQLALALLAVAPVAGLSARWTFRVLRRLGARLRDRLLARRGDALLQSLTVEREWLRSEVERWRRLLLPRA